MNHKKKLLYIISTLNFWSTLASADAGATPYFSIRSQGVNAVREMVGWQELINRCNMDRFYGAGAVAIEYSQTFSPHTIAESIFGGDLRCVNGKESSILISGSQSPNRNYNSDWLADYFGLPTDYEGSVSFNPSIKNMVADVEFYFGADFRDHWARGFYWRLNLPIVHTRWNLGFCETIDNPGLNGYPEGYFSNLTDSYDGDTLESYGVPRSNLNANASQFFSGARTPNLGSDVTFNKLCCSKWATVCDCSGASQTALANVSWTSGWNFLCCEDYHLGINTRTSAPTGSRVTGTYLFEPIVGNGHHWEFGGGISTHATLWKNECENKTIRMYVDVNLTHLYRTSQTRCFDLCQAGPNSRYMVAQRMRTNPYDVLAVDDADLSEFEQFQTNIQFANVFAPVANLTKSKVDVGIKLQSDTALKFTYSDNQGLTIDLGYNLWTQSCEEICRKKSCILPDPLDGNSWALKGDAHVFGFYEVGMTIQASPLSATQSLSTIHNGVDFLPNVSLEQAIQNNNVDNAKKPVYFQNEPTSTLQARSAGINPLISSSFPPVLLNESDINLVGTKALSQKLFAHISYAWMDDGCFNPFIGVGASVEWGSTDCNEACNSSCCSGDDCRSCAMNQWSVWVKGGIGF